MCRAGVGNAVLVLFLLVVDPVNDLHAQDATGRGNCIITLDDTVNGEEVTCTIMPGMSCDDWNAEQWVWAGYSPSELVAILGGSCAPRVAPLELLGPCGTDPDDLSCLGCDGIPYSGLIEDACGVCGGDGLSCYEPGPCGGGLEDLSCLGCDGIPYSGLIEDVCGVCGKDGLSCYDLGPCGTGAEDLSCLGCDGIPYSGLIEDACGLCGGDGLSCYSGNWA